MVSTVPGTTPLVFDSPHSGTHYPADFRSACSLPTLRRAEDTHVEKIYAFAPALGVAWVEAHFPRIYLDATATRWSWTPPCLTPPGPTP
jgi:N-formylglutamate deformylase